MKKKYFYILINVLIITAVLVFILVLKNMNNGVTISAVLIGSMLYIGYITASIYGYKVVYINDEKKQKDILLLRRNTFVIFLIPSTIYSVLNICFKLNFDYGILLLLIIAIISSISLIVCTVIIKRKKLTRNPEISN